jgi:Flp pilus assembly CpaF family ATPase
LDDTISEVMVYRGGGEGFPAWCRALEMFIERAEHLIQIDRTIEEARLFTAIQTIARLCDDEISETQSVLAARLEDGLACGGDVAAVLAGWVSADDSQVPGAIQVAGSHRPWVLSD